VSRLELGSGAVAMRYLRLGAQEPRN
jgi:hypothetical protein